MPKENRKKKHYITFGVNIDERIADGFYLIKSIKVFEQIISDPKYFKDKVSAPIKGEHHEK